MEFRRHLARHTDAVKACLQFRGPPDPLRGDEPYRKVHTAAKEALEAILDTSAPAHSAATAARTMASLSSGPASPARPGAAGGGAASWDQAARALGGGPSSGSALPGQAGYDPHSQLHKPPISTGTMQGFGNSEGPRVRAGAWGGADGVRNASLSCLSHFLAPPLPPHPPPPPTLRPAGKIHL